MKIKFFFSRSIAKSIFYPTIDSWNSLFCPVTNLLTICLSLHYTSATDWQNSICDSMIYWQKLEYFSCTLYQNLCLFQWLFHKKSWCFSKIIWWNSQFFCDLLSKFAFFFLFSDCFMKIHVLTKLVIYSFAINGRNSLPVLQSFHFFSEWPFEEICYFFHMIDWQKSTCDSVIFWIILQYFPSIICQNSSFFSAIVCLNLRYFPTYWQNSRLFPWSFVGMYIFSTVNS